MVEQDLINWLSEFLEIHFLSTNEWSDRWHVVFSSTISWGTGPAVGTSMVLQLTHWAFGSDGHRLQEDLDDAGSDPRCVLVVCVEVIQNLLDDVVGVLSLDDDKDTERI